MKKEIVGEDQGTSEKISDGDVTNRFGALFTRPIGVRVPLDKLEELDSAGDGDSGGAPGVLTHRGASGGRVPSKGGAVVTASVVCWIGTVGTGSMEGPGAT